MGEKRVDHLRFAREGCCLTQRGEERGRQPSVVECTDRCSWGVSARSLEKSGEEAGQVFGNDFDRVGNPWHASVVPRFLNHDDRRLVLAELIDQLAKRSIEVRIAQRVADYEQRLTGQAR